MRVDKGLGYGCVRGWTLGWIKNSVGWGHEEGGVCHCISCFYLFIVFFF